jgi:hypothetical protein
MAMNRAGQLGSLANSIPGYRGYRAKEDRRDADRVVRDQIANELDARAAKAEQLASRLAASRDLANVGAVNSVVQEVRLLGTRVRTASYGYGGLFGNRDVNVNALAQIQAFDETLLEGVPALDETLQSLEQAAPAGIPAAAEAVTAVVRHLSTQFDARSSVVETATPSAVQPALPPISSTLDKTDAPKPPAAFDLHDRDAIAILGDNGVSDARIDITGANPLRLFRLEGNPKRWLVVPSAEGKEFGLLTEIAPPDKVSATTLDGVEFTPASPQSGKGSAVGAGGEQKNLPVTFVQLIGATDPNARALIIDWGTERQAFRGQPVHPNDVEIFGSTLK